jgi:hypothetical protein
VRAESYLTHSPTFSTDFPHRNLAISWFRHGHSMKFAIVVAAFLIGLITGLATTPESHSESWATLQRREASINSD